MRNVFPLDDMLNKRGGLPRLGQRILPKGNGQVAFRHGGAES